MKLKSDTIYLRALEPSDLDFLYELENDTKIWEISGTITPYSRITLQKYLDNAHLDIYEAKQLRLCICDYDNHVLGLIDLFNFDPKNSRVGVGLIIKGAENRNRGVGAQVLGLVCDYAFQILDLHQLYANILEDNQASVRLFEKLGFQKAGLKKDWVRFGSDFKNEYLYQKIRA